MMFGLPLWGFYVFVVCAITNMLCYVDRLTITMAAVVLQEKYAWTEQTKGLVLGGFFFGYLFTQIPGGVLAQKYTGQRVLAAALLGWSIFTFLTPVVAHNTTYLIACRIAMGLSEGMCLPATCDVLSRVVPTQHYSRAAALVGSSQSVGIITAVLCGPSIAHNWEFVFNCWAAVGVLWAVLIETVFTRYNPTPLTPAPEEGEIVEDGSSLKDPANSSVCNNKPQLEIIKEFLQHSGCYAVFCAHFGQNWIWYFIISWLPSYLKAVVGVSLEGQHLSTVLIYLSGICGAWTGGYLADTTIRKELLSRTAVRKSAQSVVLLGGSSFFLLVGLVQSNSQVVNVMLLGMCLFCCKFCDAGVTANVLDLSSTHSGLLYGISNTIATVPGFLGNWVAGAILDAFGGQWFLIFVVSIGVSVCCWLVFIYFASTKEILLRCETRQKGKQFL
eukprot:TRINITY_DN66870_c2_g1_i1.p1 TRINITY_DN66870_c2_g1~~TRINITY_DN66870_c2_g1_i1.p1  ORF type:complete len:443 (+),score=26.59 TRINITY_DN66870_c2_g1_i1:19-1347(+)